MPVLRYSAAPETRESIAWRLFGEEEPGALIRGIAEGTVDLGPIDGDFDPSLQPRNASNPIDRHLDAVVDASGLGDPSEPIVIFVHGFQFDPRIETEETETAKSTNPHVQLYRFSEAADEDGIPGEPGSEDEHNSHATPWLRRATHDQTAEDFPGLAIGFGYESWGNELADGTPSTGDFWRALVNVDWQKGAFRNVYAQAYLDAEHAATALAVIIDRISRLLEAKGDNRPIDLFAHSLGTRTVMLALDILARKREQTRALDSVGRVLLLAGAASWIVTGKVLRNLMVARPDNPPEIFNFPSSEDAVISFLGARASLKAASDSAGIEDSLWSRVTRFVKGGEMIGREGRPDLAAFAGPKKQYDHWVDIQLDDPATKRWGQSKDYTLRGDRKGTFDILKLEFKIETLDHWVHYTTPSNWELFRDILARVDGLTPEEVRAGILEARG